MWKARKASNLFPLCKGTNLLNAKLKGFIKWMSSRRSMFQMNISAELWTVCWSWSSEFVGQFFYNFRNFSYDSCFRCEDIIIFCILSIPYLHINGKECCDKVFSNTFYSFYGACFSSHGLKMAQGYPGQVGGIRIIVRTTESGKAFYQSLKKVYSLIHISLNSCDVFCLGSPKSIYFLV